MLYDVKFIERLPRIIDVNSFENTPNYDLKSLMQDKYMVMVRRSNGQDIYVRKRWGGNIHEHVYKGIVYVASGDGAAIKGVSSDFKNHCQDGVLNIPSSLDIYGQTVSVTKVLDNAFSGNNDIESVYFPNSIEDIGGAAFEGCPFLKKVRLPYNKNYRIISHDLFNGCLNLEEIVLPENVTKIRSLAFAGCESLSYIKVENTMEISKKAFRGCYNLFNIQADKYAKKK